MASAATEQSLDAGQIIETLQSLIADGELYFSRDRGNEMLIPNVRTEGGAGAAGTG